MLSPLKSILSFIPHLFTLYAIKAENETLKKEIDHLNAECDKSNKDYEQYKRDQSHAYDVLKSENEMLREKLNHNKLRELYT